MKIKGEGRVILKDLKGQTVEDTGWNSNTITDNFILMLTNGSSVGSLDIFIHESTAPGRTSRTALNGVYANQTPSQIRNPDTTSFSESLGLSIFTVQFPAPAVDRDINIVGLTLNTGVGLGYISGIVAYTALTTTVPQTTALTADVQYRITWSFT